MTEEKNFYNSNTAEIDAKLLRDTISYERKSNIILLIAILFMMLIFRGYIFYWLKFGIAIPSSVYGQVINPLKDPVQIDYPLAEQKSKAFIYHSLINENKMVLIPQAHYNMSGKAVAYNHDFLFVSKFFDSAALYDLGTAWGDLSHMDMFKKYIKIDNTKNEVTGGRYLSWRYSYNAPYSGEYINSHVSHTHAIPANRNIMAALLKIKKYQTIRLEGELVDMKRVTNASDNADYQTSLSRTDTDQTSRGSGACETLYVTEVQIENKVYR